jgi:RNA polymerase sigma-70 factor (ECF subfamily)
MPPTDSRSATRLHLERLPVEPHASWASLLRRVESRLRVLLALRGCDDPDEVLQEVWIQAVQGLGAFEYRGPGSLQRWLAGIARNKLRERERGRRSAPISAGVLDASDGPAHGLLAALRDSRPGVSTEVGRRELEERVRAALEQLPEPEREAVLLRLYEGLSVREAGGRLGVDPSTVSLRVKRALGRCAAALGAADPV